MSVAKTSKDPCGKQDFNKINEEMAATDYQVKQKEIQLTTDTQKDSKLLIDYVIIIFDNQPYIVTKIVK